MLELKVLADVEFYARVVTVGENERVRIELVAEKAPSVIEDGFFAF